jgi:hypothetical protein
MSAEQPQQLIGLIEFASKALEQIFTVRGCIDPMWHAVTVDGRHLILSNPHEDKDIACSMVRTALANIEARAVVFISEAWTGIATDNSAEAIQRARENLRDEVVHFQAEDETGELTARRPIIREVGRPPRLGALQIEPRALVSEGRMVGWLPRPERAQLH